MNTEVLCSSGLPLVSHRSGVAFQEHLPVTKVTDEIYYEALQNVKNDQASYWMFVNGWQIDIANDSFSAELAPSSTGFLMSSRCVVTRRGTYVLCTDHWLPRPE